MDLFVVSLFLLNYLGASLFVENFALTPSSILSFQNIWTIITSMFVHLSFFHLFANMFSLFFIGNFLERIIGRLRLFWVYMISGIIGGLFFVTSGFIFSNNISGVGASGAIFGLLGVLAILVPYSRIYLITGPLVVLIFMILFPQFAALGNILILVMIFAMFSFNSRLRAIAIPLEMPMWVLPIVAIVPLIVIGFYIPLPIGNSAHLGGLIVGLAYGFYLRKKFPRKTDLLRKHFR